MVPAQTPETLLLIDTCGERGSVALARGTRVEAEVTLPARAASAGLLAAVRQVLDAAHVELRGLSGVGVVNGPGSFTGLRVGLAVCKGLCEATGVRLATVSRLEVLAHAADLQNGIAVLRAGRDQVYALEVRAGIGLYERLMDVGAVLEVAGHGDVVLAEDSLLPALQQGNAALRCVELSASDALEKTRERLASGGSDLAFADANYVRDEEAIYARPTR